MNKLFDIQPLTLEMTKQYEHESFIELLDNYDTDKELVDDDFIFGKVIIDDTEYHMIHGFPGDEPQGIIYTPSQYEVYDVHWSMDNTNKL